MPEAFERRGTGMNGKTVRQCSTWALPALLGIHFALTAGCSGRSATTRYYTSTTGSNCYAKALPTSGTGRTGLGFDLERGPQEIHGELYALRRSIRRDAGNVSGGVGGVQEAIVIQSFCR